MERFLIACTYVVFNAWFMFITYEARVRIHNNISTMNLLVDVTLADVDVYTHTFVYANVF